MGVIAGFGGSLSLTGPGTAATTQSANVLEWSADMDVDVITVPPPFGCSQEGATLGQGRITGSFNAQVDTGLHPFPTCATNAGWTTVMQFNALTLTLDSASSSVITISSPIVNKISVKRPHTGVCEITANFRNSN
jgi:hypothetical protein